MKCFLIFFSIYIFALSAVPCGDKGSCNECSETYAASPAETHHHDNICSPFCLCSCCGSTGFQLVTTPVTVEPLVLNKEGSLLYYSEQIISHYSQNIWQPPKIG